MREQDIWQRLRRRSSVFAAARKNLEPITLQQARAREHHRLLCRARLTTRGTIGGVVAASGRPIVAASGRPIILSVILGLSRTVTCCQWQQPIWQPGCWKRCHNPHWCPAVSLPASTHAGTRTHLPPGPSRCCRSLWCNCGRRVQLLPGGLLRCSGHC